MTTGWGIFYSTAMNSHNKDKDTTATMYDLINIAVPTYNVGSTDIKTVWNNLFEYDQ